MKAELHKPIKKSKFTLMSISNLFTVATAILVIGYSCSKEGNTEWPKEDPVLSTPYCEKDDIIIHGTYSEATNAPWGRIHQGIDFATYEDSVPFKAPFDGIIEKSHIFNNGGNWQVNIHIKYNETFSMIYAFEPMTQDESDGKIQFSHIKVKTGDRVKKNDIIGLLHNSNGFPHVHFSLYKNNEFICPEQYFEPEARISIMDIVYKYHPDWNMCY